jgi:hypothetical protein
MRTAADHHATGWHHWSYRTVRLFLPIRKARR